MMILDSGLLFGPPCSIELLLLDVREPGLHDCAFYIGICSMRKNEPRG